MWIIKSDIIPATMRIHTATLSAGISRTREFEKKGLAQFAVNVGTKCGHGCLYCSTGAMLRMHPSFKAAGESPFESGYAIVDPSTPERVVRDAVAIRKRGLVQLCTTVDAWSPETQQHQLGRRCLEAVLSQPGWTVRILTKNAAVSGDFDLIERHRDRVLLGLSLTATEDKSRITAVTEPWASPVSERMKTLEQAHRRCSSSRSMGGAPASATRKKRYVPQASGQRLMHWHQFGMASDGPHTQRGCCGRCRTHSRDGAAFTS